MMAQSVPYRTEEPVAGMVGKKAMAKLCEIWMSFNVRQNVTYVKFELLDIVRKAWP